MMWTIKKAFDVVSLIQKTIRPKFGYNVCIYGSVLYKGYSYNDLDLQVIPFKSVNDKPHDHDLLANAIAESLEGEVKGSLKLKALGESCYIIEFDTLEGFHRIDLVIRRTIPYLPTEDEILEAAKKINEKRELLKKCNEY